MVHILPAMMVAQERPVPLRQAPSTTVTPPDPAQVARFLWLGYPLPGGVGRNRAPVWLETVKAAPALDRVYLYTFAVDPSAEDRNRGGAMLDLYYAFRTADELTVGYEVAVEGQCGTSHFAARREVWHTCGNYHIPVPDARLWYPKNAGEQNLYDVRVTLLRNGVVEDAREFRIGIRLAELDRTSCIDADGKGNSASSSTISPYSSWAATGCRWMHSTAATRSACPRHCAPSDEAGCNAVRCWGGNVYEDTPFFDFCDEHGILVWQDFAMGCALYPVWDEGLRENLRREALSVVRKLRHHPSLCLWAGDNECDLFWMMCYPFRRNPAENTLTRELLRDVLRAEDFTVPTCPPRRMWMRWRLRAGRREPRRITSGDRATTSRAISTAPHPATLLRRPAITAVDPALPAGVHPGGSALPIYDEGTAEDPFRGTPNPAWLAHQTSMELNETNTFGYRIGLMTSQVRHMSGMCWTASTPTPA